MKTLISDTKSDIREQESQNTRSNVFMRVSWYEKTSDAWHWRVSAANCLNQIIKFDHKAQYLEDKNKTGQSTVR